MKCNKDTMLLYAVTDRKWTGKQTLVEQVESALIGGVTCIQLREKCLDEELFLDESKKIKLLCEKYKVPFIINDNVQIAIKCKADGVHVGQSDMEVKKVRELIGDNKIIGVSAHNVEEAIKAEKDGADYLGVGAMFTTTTKDNTCKVSFDLLKKICNSVSIPVVAIGGINKHNLKQLSGTNVDGVALVSAIFASDNIEEECKILRKLSKEMISK